MGKKYIIRYNREGCIGAAPCAAVAPAHWKMNDDGKADLISGKNKGSDRWEKEIDEEDLKINIEAAEGCPVNVIEIYEKDTKKKIV